MTEQKPTVGRIVHLFDRRLAAHTPQGIGPYAAIVTFVHADGQTIDVAAFPSLSAGYYERVPLGDDGSPTGLWWLWPPRTWTTT